MYGKPLVPRSFCVPLLVRGPGFLFRPLTVDDLVPDFVAVSSSAEHIAGHYDQESRWPIGLTLQENLIDLGWHQREFLNRTSFAYTIRDEADRITIGCLYIYPASATGYEAQATFWMTQSVARSGVDQIVFEFLKHWISTAWPFRSCAFPGRTMDWRAFKALSGREPPDAATANSRAELGK